MNINEIDNIIDELDIKSRINLDDVPELDLYMDQVIQLFEGKLSGVKRWPEDKVLTKTMINNYAKAKLLMSVKNKKYSKEHLILMSFIYDLKGGLSIGDTKLLLNNIVDKYENGEEYNLRELYSTYLRNIDVESEEFTNEVKNKIERINSIEGDFEEYEKNFLLICSMINMSNLYRRVSEKLVDRFFNVEDK